MAQGNEASVEEILESIKKVIARDNREAAANEQKRKVAQSEEMDAAEPVALDTDDQVEVDEILDLADMEFSEDQPEDVTDQDEMLDGPLITEEVRGAMQENLAALAMLAEPGAKPQIVRSGETSLEGLTRELLRPMLAQWLDDNLPNMVERMVQAEIARIAGKRG